ncbi:MAG: hypothetical protein K0S23_274 [Fluviicola sp.]|jgi:hypothetical protein|uniref:hypothetical protein n=1 Tax=Fluviicola sp. TaxID=1917219 RepID=UPI002604B312|nr:hypothetical protein [Fluviicola sp.]MDF3025967.1 hypothetical protein [Fluviicola sp.]
MVFGLFLLKLLGFYLIYTNSAKTTYVLSGWEQLIRKQKIVSLSLGGFLIGITLAGFMLLFGFAGGLFYDLTCLMLLASLTVLLRPLITKEQAKTHSHAGK